MNIDFISLIFLFGALQSLLLLIGINLNKPLDSDVKKLTSLLLFVLMIVMVYYVVVFYEIESIYPYIDSLSTASWMAIAPLFYLLCKSVADPKWTLSRKNLFLFPISIVFLIEGILTTLGLPVWLYQIVNDSYLFLNLWMGAFFSTGLFFIGKSIVLIRSQKEDRNIELIWFAYLFFITLLSFSIIYIFIRHNYVVTFEYTLILLFLSFILILVIKVFKVSPFQHFFNITKARDIRISKQGMQDLANRLEATMDSEKPYLDKKLNLNTLSQLSQINTNELSQLFSIYYESNFYEFINHHRLNHLEKRILNPENDQYKIAALAEDSGFNSKATFYKVFKEKHQLTPKQYIKRYRK